MTKATSSFQRSFDVERLEHSAKTAIACLIGFGITKSIHVGVDQWLLVTIVVVMCAQINVGSVIQKSYMRFLGTLTGSLLAILTLTFFGTNPIASAAMITCSTMLFSFIATSTKSYNESGTLGAVTVIIILIGQQPTIITATERCIEISFGILIAALVSQFILPIHARNHLRRNQAETVLLLRDYYQKTFMHKNETAENQPFLDEEVSKILIKQRKLASEAKQELFGEAFNINYFRQRLWCEKEIMRSITFMYHAYQASYAGRYPISHMDALKKFHSMIYDVLGKISIGLENQVAENILIPNAGELKNMFSGVIQQANEDEKVALYTFLFCADVLVARLEKLAGLISK